MKRYLKGKEITKLINLLNQLPNTACYFSNVAIKSWTSLAFNCSSYYNCYFKLLRF